MQFFFKVLLSNGTLGFQKFFFRHRLLFRSLSVKFLYLTVLGGTGFLSEAKEQTQDTLEGLCLSAALGMPWCSTGQARGGGHGEGGLGFSAKTAAPRPRKAKQDG